jgi:hypothetical protein
VRAFVLFWCVVALLVLAPAARAVGPDKRARMVFAIHQWWQPPVVQDEREITQLRSENRKLKRRLNYHAAWVRRLQRIRRPDVYYALKLASIIWGVPQPELRAVGRCESGLDPGAKNGRYRGVFQEGPMFEAGPFGRAGFSVWDPLANIFTAAYTVSLQGWRQWQCQP